MCVGYLCKTLEVARLRHLLHRVIATGGWTGETKKENRRSTWEVPPQHKDLHSSIDEIMAMVPSSMPMVTRTPFIAYLASNCKNTMVVFVETPKKWCPSVNWSNNLRLDDVLPCQWATESYIASRSYTSKSPNVKDVSAMVSLKSKMASFI